MRQYGFNEKVQGYEHLIAIYRILDNELQIIQDESIPLYKILPQTVLIIPDNKYKDRKDIQKHQAYLSKPFYSYTNKVFKNSYTESDYKKRVEQRKEIDNKYKKESNKQKQKEKKKEQQGIYGIYIDNELVYIGKTEVSFKTRFKQHKDNMDNGDTTYIYKLLREAKLNNRNIQMKPLITLDQIKVDGKLTSKDIQAMELGLITLYQPQGNVKGRLQNYQFK